MNLDRPHPQALYRMYDAERRLLYVGITSSWPHRLSQHERDKAWWCDVSHIAVEWHPTRRAVEKAECAAIFAERPIHNVAGASALPVQSDADRVFEWSLATVGSGGAVAVDDLDAAFPTLTPARIDAVIEQLVADGRGR